jgi:hypothetical protein
MLKVWLRSCTFAGLLVVGVVLGSPTDGSATCDVPDDGSGTVALPPAGCGYLSATDFHMIVSGLPVGTEIIMEPIHSFVVCGKCQVACGSQPGGTLAGEIETACTIAKLRMHGNPTGIIPEFRRTIEMRATIETHTAPRTPGTSPQTFNTVMYKFDGALDPFIQDPDFASMSITAGTGNGFPSPGTTTLTQLPSGDWTADSQFSINYELSFVGAAGGPLDGFAGTTTGTIQMDAQNIGLPSSQAKCAVGMSKSGVKISKARLGATGACVKTAAASFPTTVSTATCNADDSKGKVAGAVSKLTAFDTAKCVPDPPSYGYTNAATTGGAAVGEMNNAVSDLLGAGAAVNTAADVSCLVGINKTFAKAMDTKLKEFVGCKKGVKKGKKSAPQVVDAVDLSRCIGGDPKGKIQKTIDKMSAQVDKCTAAGADLLQVFPGCGSANPVVLKQCLSDRLKCRSCLAVETEDNLAGECDLLDNGALDTSCP